MTILDEIVIKYFELGSVDKAMNSMKGQIKEEHIKELKERLENGTVDTETGK